MAVRGVDIACDRPQKVHLRGMRAMVAARYPLESFMGRFTRNLRLLSCAGALSLLAGCGSLLTGPTPQLDTFELTAPQLESRSVRSRMQILVAEPSALKSLDSQNILIEVAPGEIAYLKGAQWADRLPRIVQARLADAFQRGGGFAGVGRPGEGLAIDYQVVMELRTFGVRVSGGQRAEVDIFVKLLNDRNGTVRAARNFTASVPVGGGDNDAYVRAINAAFATVARDIVNWTASTL
mgnify:FL=1|jgi:ABC-type uncharacterized transport system, auxiliary component